VFTNPLEKSSSPSTSHSRFLIFKKNLISKICRISPKKLALLVELTQEKQKFPKIPNLKINKYLSN
jgi:hypothetical protein